MLSTKGGRTTKTKSKTKVRSNEEICNLSALQQSCAGMIGLCWCLTIYLWYMVIDSSEMCLAGCLPRRRVNCKLSTARGQRKVSCRIELQFVSRISTIYLTWLCRVNKIRCGWFFSKFILIVLIILTKTETYLSCLYYFRRYMLNLLSLALKTWEICSKQQGFRYRFLIDCLDKAHVIDIGKKSYCAGIRRFHDRVPSSFTYRRTDRRMNRRTNARITNIYTI